MKIFTIKNATLLLLGILIHSCASRNAHYGSAVANNPISEKIERQEVAHTFYLVGDAGNLENSATVGDIKSLEAKNTLNQLKDKLDSANAKSTLIFLGDNIYPKGLPNKKSKDRKIAEAHLDNQIALAKNYKGQTIFIPGNHDWYSNGIIGLENQQDYITKKLQDKKAFAPKNSCAIETRKIDKNIALIIVDSEWFLADWNKNPGINEKCEIKTREDFFEAFEGELNKNQNRTIVVAFHHPLLDNGSHGGKFSLEKQIFPLENKFPLPILGSFMNLMRATGGITHQDLSNENYRKLSSRIQTLLADRDNVIVVSGHDHNLQYIEKDNIHQIISGAGSKSEAASAIGKSDFSYGKNGYAVLEISKSGDAEVSYFGRENNTEKLLYRKQILKNSDPKIPSYPYKFPTEIEASVYDVAMTKKGKFYEFLWGKNYRNLYSEPIKAPVLALDTLFGGAQASRSGGGHQTNSLRLETPKGEYVLRALKKSGIRFLQSVAFKNQYMSKDLENGFADQFLLDFFTSSHPYTPLAIGNLSDQIGIKHSNPELFYVPKQNRLGKFNQNFGDELYYLEKRPEETLENPSEILSTHEVIKLLAKDEKYVIDEKSYIRARLFDMLIGDWDRHQDQWKWEQRKENGSVYISPIPKDRDQAFVKYDGFLTKIILAFPELKHMQSFGPKIKNIKWFNREAYAIDLAFTKNSTLADWLNEAEYIQQNLDKNDIEKALDQLPNAAQNENLKSIKQNLEIRKNDLKLYAKQYFNILQETVLLTGTDKKDKFIINRLNNKETEIKIYRLKKSGEELTFNKIYSKDLTKEIWIYGLSDDDEFEVNGNKSGIKIRLLGGLNNDVYTINNNKNVKIYDYKTKKNTFNNKKTNVKLTDDYYLNEYNFTRPKYSFFTQNLNIGFNPDDGLIVGINAVYEKKGFKQNPFSAKHKLLANYFTSSKGYEFAYAATIPNLTGNWFYQIDAGISSSKFIRNFFGVGNLTENYDDLFEENYYRVRAKDYHFAPSLNWKKNAASFTSKLVYEAIEIEKTDARRIATANIVNEDVFKTNHFGGADISFNYLNLNNKANPSLGMKLDIDFSYRQNLFNNDKKLPSIATGLGFIHYLTNNEKLILSTYAKAKWLLSNDYEFYQMTTLGGNDHLRAYNFDRFYGKSSFYQTTDLRVNLGTFRNSFLPLNFGIYSGFDYGRVWIPTENTDKWHNSFGGGIWINALDQLVFQGSYFYAKDGGRFAVTFGLNF
ncbi:metallophosphoesterase [Frigoriflavimonas asaccharolytica]|uniref:Putative phosphodiesterase n=1 Tax=Frigoriflavimonas asaccharolytica TaxID=2735899 RepID=A0A8J8GB66_9FLAO|nr:metallophosphoesterase [Frigoriflavimonas asaccharolytica]NRS93312.1 putative phosphodiesterase [Frigoriflavimonas asaccharolytica]